MRATILSTYPPRACGLATFAQNLRGGLLDAGVATDVVASVRERGASGRLPEVACEIDQDGRPEYATCLSTLGSDVLSVQHEFGIFGGAHGAYVLDALDAAPCPAVTTLHTVLPKPSPEVRAMLASVAERSARLVVMTETARDLLRDVYGVPAEKVAVIPHGTPEMDPPPPHLRAQLGLEGRTVLLTFGLLGPSKGIEFALASLAPVVEADPDALYVVLGATHPEIVKHEGEAYRDSLEAEVAARGLSDHVRFVNQYVTGDELGRWLQAADVYVSPYPGMDQICSGTLAYALAAGLPVVSTPYLHAAEVLAGEAGTLVTFGDEDAFGAALARYAADDDARAHASAAARAIGAATAWPATGAAYRSVFEEVVRETQHAASEPASLRVHPAALPAALDALAALTDDIGPIQHATYGVPDRRHGYSADDAARTLVAVYGSARRLSLDPDVLDAGRTCLSFLLHAQRPDGTFHNFMDYGRRWSDAVGSEDTTGRALWGLGATAAWAPVAPLRRLAFEMAERSQHVRFEHARAAAYALCGLDLALEFAPDHGGFLDAVRAHTDHLLDLYARASAPDWQWFCDSMTYSNAVVPHALARGAARLGDQRAAEVASESATFLLSETVRDGRFDAVGNRGWRRRNGDRAAFDQQPVDAGYAAWFWARSEDPVLRRGARAAVAWFYGHNRTGEALFDEASGACFDGLTEAGVNRNQGAESVLACVLAHLAAVDLGLVAAPAELARRTSAKTSTESVG